MSNSITFLRDAPRSLTLAVALQFGCGMAFMVDFLSEIKDGAAHAGIEALAIVALWTGGAITLNGLYRLSRRNEAVETQLMAATGEFQRMMDKRFDEWGLTPSERDVAILSVKGMSIAEIADARATREGTIKAQNASIYRKSGVSSRADLLSLLIDEIVAGLPVPDSAKQ